jgi:hypothetical protein
MEENRDTHKWTWSDLGKILKNSLLAIFKGEFLMSLRFNKYFIHILFTFVLFFVSIWLGMNVEKTLIKVESNKKILNDLEIYHAQKTVEIVSLNRLTTIQKLLQQDSSKVTIPEKQATIIKKGK